MKRGKISFLTTLTLFLSFIFLWGCALQQKRISHKADISPQENLEEKLDLLNKKIVECIKYRGLALSNFAIVDESSLGRKVQSRLSAFIVERLKHFLTKNNFSVVDIRAIHFQDLIENRPLSLPQTVCERKEFPEVILLFDLKDYGPSTDYLYLTIRAKKTDSNKFISGVAVEEKLKKTPKLFSWLKDTVPLRAIQGTKKNPFEDLDRGARYLVREICCPYQELLREWKKEGWEQEKINPEEIVLAVMAINRDGEKKIGKFERKLMAKLKHYLIKECEIENTVDFSDLALIDEKIAFYEKEGSFFLDFTVSNRERFNPATVLLIAETQTEEGIKEVMLRAAWMKGEIETNYGRGMRVGGTYLKGFAASAYFRWEELLQRRPRICVLFNSDPGAKVAEEMIRSFLANKGYQVVGADEPAELSIEGELITQSCFREIDTNCYDFYLRKLEIKDRKGVLVKTLPILDKGGRKKYIGHSHTSETKEEAILSGVGMLWGRLKDDFFNTLRECIHFYLPHRATKGTY